MAAASAPTAWLEERRERARWEVKEGLQRPGGFVWEWAERGPRVQEEQVVGSVGEGEGMEECSQPGDFQTMMGVRETRAWV